MKKINLPNFLLDAVPALLAFLLPIFFLSVTAEFFEFNKLALLTIATALMLLIWAAKMLLDKSVRAVRSRLDLAFLALTAVFILSTIFSLDKTASLFGSQGRWFPSLASLLVLTVFYYIVSTNISSAKAIKAGLAALLGGACVSSLVAILSYYKVYLGPQQYFNIQNFTLSGSSTTAGVLAAVGVVIAAGLIAHSNGILAKSGLYLLAALNIFAAMLIGGVPAAAVLIAGLLALALLLPTQTLVQNKMFGFALAGLALALAAVMVFPPTKSVLLDANYPKELRLSAKDSWLVVSSALRDYPLLGAGPSTFYLVFPNYRPLSMNSSDFWNIRYDKAYSEALGVVGSLGIVGVLAAIFFVVTVLRYVLNSKGTHSAGNFTAVSGAVIIAVLAAFVFTYATVTTAFVLFFALAMLTAGYALDPESRLAEHVGLSLASLRFKTLSSIGTLAGGSTEEKKNESFQYIAVVPLAAAAIASMYFLYKNYAGEVYMRKAIEAAQLGDGAKTYEFQRAALNVNPLRAQYQNSYARTNLALARSISAKGAAQTDEDKKTVQTLASQAIRSVRLSTEVLSPPDVVGWETRGLVYRSLRDAAADAGDWAVKAYTAAVRLDPGNPRLRVDFGGIYFAGEDYLSAANMFRQAVNLKGDYANAHYNFGHALAKLGQYADAQREFEAAMGLVPAGSEDYSRVAADVAAVKSMGAAQAASAAAAAKPVLPSVAEIEGGAPAVAGATSAAPAAQEPLTQPGSVDTGAESKETTPTP